MERAPFPVSSLDLILTTQFAVAWAGESGEEPRLGWWRSEFVSEFGGEDLFRRLLPATWKWAVLQGAREAARRRDAELRAKDHDPDSLLTLFSLGSELGERVEERLQDLKRGAADPPTSLPGLRDVLSQTWSRDRFADWICGHSRAHYVTAPAGRRIQGPPPHSIDLAVKELVAALAPLGDAYPLPHYKRIR